jgi:c-di-GMP-binding flagellar brake protein YcgR
MHRHCADERFMSTNAPTANPPNRQRSVFRLSMIADEPVYLLLSMDGVKIDPVIDELGGGGARLVSAKHFDRFYEGQLIGPAVLVLQVEGMPVVYPVVKWKSWPVIGVEFLEINEKDREMILRFLFKIERRLVRRLATPAVRR